LFSLVKAYVFKPEELELLISGVAIPKAAASQEEDYSEEGAQAEGQVKDRVDIFVDKTSA